MGDRRGLEGRGDRGRPAQGGRGDWWSGRPPGCATATSTSSPATWCRPTRRWQMMGLDRRSSRSSAATRAPASIAEVGPGVTSVQPGDHVSASFIPSCGRCRYCSTGRQNLCDLGAGAFHTGHDHRRHEPPPGRRRGPAASSPSSARSPSTPRGRGVGHQGRRRPARSRPSPWCRAAWPPAGARRSAGRREAGRDGGGRRHRRHRHQRRAGRQDGRRQARDRRRPDRVQAGEGDGVRRHPHRGDA